jgi:hypothetical protein
VFVKQVPILVHSSSTCSSIVTTVLVVVLVVVVSITASTYHTADIKIVVLYR